MNHKQEELIRLRVIVLNQSKDGPVPPIERIKAAFAILRKHAGKQGGVSERNIPIIRSVIKEFVNSTDADIQLRALKLRKTLNARLALGKEPDVPEESVTATTTATPAPVPEASSTVAFTSVNAGIGTLFLTADGLRKIIATKIGDPLWHDFSEGRIELSREQQVELLRAVANVSFLWEKDVQAIMDALGRPSRDGRTPADDFPALIRIAEEYLERVKLLFDRWKQLVKEDQPGVA